ncbi:MAG TPA: response regulator, partial [Verrucomicrobiota bacterium]|nr:response regulator [Verrucomicrobiota bacterium]
MSATGSNRVASDRVSARLVVLDDEAAHMRALCDTLREQGYEVSGFATPGEALAAVQPGRFDLLLVDLMMPEMDGISVLKRAAEVDPDIASVVMTGQGTIETAVRAMKAGALDYILKPFKLSAILPVLARALSIRQLRVENRE